MPDAGPALALVTAAATKEFTLLAELVREQGAASAEEVLIGVAALAAALLVELARNLDVPTELLLVSIGAQFAQRAT